MPKRSQIPSYRLHKATGQAVVTLDGRDFYLGPHGSADSHARYERLVAEFLTRGRRMPREVDKRISVGEVCLAFFKWAQDEYRLRDGSQSREVANVRIALRPLVDLFLDKAAEDFGPLDLKHYRDRLLETEYLARSTINQRLQIVRRVFRWATEMELVPPKVLQGLEAVRGLRKGRCRARETEPVQPVPDEHIEAALAQLSPIVATMVRLQLLTGARPGEIVRLRPCDIDMSGEVWLYRPPMHKNSWRGLERTIPVGPKGQALLGPLLRPGYQERYLFSPKDAQEYKRAKARKNRKTPLWPSHLRAQERRRKKDPGRAPRDRYDTTSYAQAVRRACQRAGVPTWTPGRLRHNAATATRRQYGLEAASALLGHKRVETTQIYSDVREETAVRIAKEIG